MNVDVKSIDRDVNNNMSKKFWLTRLLGKFGKKVKVVVEPAAEESTVEDTIVEPNIEDKIEEPTEDTIVEPNIEEPTVAESQEVKKKSKVLTAEEKRKIRVLRYLGYQD